MPSLAYLLCLFFLLYLFSHLLFLRLLPFSLRPLFALSSFLCLLYLPFCASSLIAASSLFFASSSLISCSPLSFPFLCFLSFLCLLFFRCLLYLLFCASSLFSAPLFISCSSLSFPLLPPLHASVPAYTTILDHKHIYKHTYWLHATHSYNFYLFHLHNHLLITPYEHTHLQAPHVSPAACTTTCKYHRLQVCRAVALINQV